jgi:hypothetical protein
MMTLSEYFSNPENVHNAIMWGIFAVPLIALVFVFLKMFRSDKKRINGRLDQFARQIDLCSNESDLLTIRSNLIKYASRHCNHETYRHQISNLLISTDVKHYRLVNNIQ